MKITGKEPSAPCKLMVDSGQAQLGDVSKYYSGLTIRQKFAMAAMHGILSNSSVNSTNKSVATVAVSMADDLIEALNRGL